MFTAQLPERGVKNEKFTPCRGWGRREPSLDLLEVKIKLEFSVSHDMREAIQDTGETRMAKLLVPYLFKWQDVEAKSDLERLRLVLEHLPYEALMKKLEAHQDKGGTITPFVRYGIRS